MKFHDHGEYFTRQNTIFFFRRNQDGDRDKALDILQRLCTTKETASELTNDISCLYGRIYKDKFKQSGFEEQAFLKKAIEWYQRGFEANPNI